MKIMKYIVPALLGGMLTLQSCEHFLDTKPTETYSEELVWGSRSTADAFVLRTYPDILGLYRHSCISPWQYNHVIQRLWTL